MRLGVAGTDSDTKRKPSNRAIEEGRRQEVNGLAEALTLLYSTNFFPLAFCLRDDKTGNFCSIASLFGC
jgi:hypothetical protein